MVTATQDDFEIFYWEPCDNGVVHGVGANAIGEQGFDRARLRELCERYGLSELAVFGSRARGDAQPDSDIDLIYVLAPGRRLGFALNQLEDELAALFDHKVDLVSKNALHRMLKDEVVAQARTLYAA